MKKIFSLPSISTNSRKSSEFYSNHAGIYLDHSNSSIDLTDEKRNKLEQLQSKLSVLYEELEKVMVQEEELTILNYRNKKQKIEPISNFGNSIESINDKLNYDSKSSSSSSKSLDDKINFNITERIDEKSTENSNSKSNGHLSVRSNDRSITKLNEESHLKNVSTHNQIEADEIDNELDVNSNYKTKNEVEEVIKPKFYHPLGESNLINQINIDLNNQTQSDHQSNQNSNDQSNNQIDQPKNDKISRKRVNGSKSFVINRSKIVNLPIFEQDENSSGEATLLNKKYSNLKQKLSSTMNENNQLKSNLKKTIDNENEIRLNCKRLEEKIKNQKDKIDQLQSRLTDSIANYNKLKVENERFKVEMQIEREKFTNFVLEETKLEQSNSEKQLKRKLKEKDQLIANLINEINQIKSNSINKNITIDLVEKNKLLSSQQIHLDQAIKNISIYQKNNIPELLMINLDDTSDTGRFDHSNFLNKLSQQDQSNQHNRSDQSTYLNQKQNESTDSKKLLKNNQKSLHNETDQSTIQLSGSIRQFCDQINLLQKEFSLIVDEEKKRTFMVKIEEFVLKNMRKLVVDKMDFFFDNLQLYLAQLKFEIIQFAIENEQKRIDQQSIYANNRKSTSSIEWLKFMTSNLTNLNKKDPKSIFLDYNNNSKLIEHRNCNLRTNLQSRTVERKLIELRRSIETYLKSYLVRIVLEIQEQNNH